MEQWMKTFEVWYMYNERLLQNPYDEVALMLEKHYAKVLDQLRMDVMK